MYKLFLIATTFGLATLVLADTPGPPREGKTTAPLLKLGDPAPALKVTRWLQGAAVPKFEPGKVYVVYFWATWCAPCAGNMPHLTELQARYKDQGVTVIGYTTRNIRGGPDNSEKKVVAFLDRQRGKPGYTFAYADDRTFAEDWLKGHDSFWAFVVDRTGHIAYMGHPMFLNLALHKVLARDASAKAVGTEMARIIAEYQSTHAALVSDFQAGRDLKGNLRALIAFEERYPQLTDLLPIVQARLSLLPKHGKPGEGREYAEAVVTRAIQQKNVRLLELACSILRNEKESKASLALAVRAADAQVRIDGGKNPQSLLTLADAYFVSGDKARAKNYAREAIQLAEGDSAADREDIATRARALGVEN